MGIGYIEQTVGADSISALNMDAKNIHISKRVDMESTPTQNIWVYPPL